ncbi:MAG: pyridoxal phosphate-dependent aminotransferase [Eubacterium sp.]|nr:pyridoxal phosphate-dependent aminotransferase [Eubacterium sp.]
MISKQYKDMLSNKLIIRQFSEFAIARGAEIGYENVFDYSIGNPSVAPPQKFTDTMIHLLQSSNSIELHGYSQTLGIPAVRQKVADYLNKRFDMDYTRDHIFMSTGAAGAVAHALRCVTAPGDEVLIFAPFFAEYWSYVNLSGAVMKVVPADLECFQLNFEAFEEMLTEKVTAVMINTPNNPSGTVYTSKTLQKLADIMTAKEEEYGHDIFLISDEPYREIVFAGTEAPYATKFYPNSISCYSFSKSLSIPGERLGYVAVNPAARGGEYIADMCGQVSRGMGHNCPPSIIQLAAAECLDITSDLSVYEINMNILYKELISLGFECVKPGGTFYMFPKSPEEDAIAFCEKAKKYDLVLVPSDDFGVQGYFRIAYCIDTEKVERSLEAFRNLVKDEHYFA